MLKNKKIIVAVTGSIAAYKSAFLIRLLIKQGAEVHVIMTAAATQFIPAITLATLSKNKVLVSFIDDENWNNHVELGLTADLILIAPATANTISKMANGICDNLLQAVYLSAKCPVAFAPAMDLDMWLHPSTQKNVAALQQYGNYLIDVENGELASGLVGKGRMAEPEKIVEWVNNYFESTNELKKLNGKNILITAGPTFEPIDPVRFIGNRSSGKMGIELAEMAAKSGANVTLLLGDTSLKANHSNIKTFACTTAQKMYEKAMEYFTKSDITICAAAVADYTPIITASEKIKKSEGNLMIELKKTTDVLAELGKLKTDKQILVGFALETNNELENAKTKLKNKNADIIVLNSLNNNGAGFQHATNQITIIDSKSNKIDFDLKLKTQVAIDILNHIIKYYV
ncbi:MAG: bifunctional phosphopantothenoylcysteine decarboxylase/phosphopantothenate--cysteine ligase CoaBC [Bacteroidota bacterium]